MNESKKKGRKINWQGHVERKKKKERKNEKQNEMEELVKRHTFKYLL